MNPRQNNTPPVMPDATKNHSEPVRERHVENYVGVPLQERLRIKLERFVAAFPDAIPEEDLFAMLLDLGLEEAAALPLAKLKRIVPNQTEAQAAAPVQGTGVRRR